MRRSVHLAWSLMRIRHLTFSLFLFPLVCGVILVLAQLITTGLFVKSITPEVFDTAVSESKDDNLVRFLLYGSGEKRPPMIVCRWVPHPKDPSKEIPPHGGCRADSLDVGINVADPDSFVVDQYVEIFQGQIDRLHVCRHCRPQVVITVGDDGKSSTFVGSMYGLAVISLAFLPKEEIREGSLEHFKVITENMGDFLFFMPDAAGLVLLSSKNGALMFTANIVPLVIIALWLAVRAHRKVLDYFSSNNVLLPLVAATGKRTFYSALWILTVARVACFLAASLPLIYFGLTAIGGEGIFDSLKEHPALIMTWMVAIVAAAGLATIVTSVADLKHRQEWYSILYRYVPLVLALIGSSVWGATFILPTAVMGVVRSVVLALPVVGLGPLCLAPITLPALPFVLVHAVMSVVLIVVILRRNARWFGAHLEEV